MFELCDNLIGIYKTYNCTKTITIDPRIYDKKENRITSSNTENNQTNETRTDINGEINDIQPTICEEDVNVDKNKNDSLSNTQSQSNLSSNQTNHNEKIIDESFQDEPMEVDCNE